MKNIKNNPINREHTVLQKHGSTLCLIAQSLRTESFKNLKFNFKILYCIWSSEILKLNFIFLLHLLFITIYKKWKTMLRHNK